MDRDRYWFAPKAFGFGSGLPIAWQGWVVYAALFASLALAGVFVPPVWRLTVIVALVVVFGAICWRKTEGGWRWRP